jgi:hypothetical protein
MKKGGPAGPPYLSIFPIVTRQLARAPVPGWMEALRKSIGAAPAKPAKTAPPGGGGSQANRNRTHEFGRPLLMKQPLAAGHHRLGHLLRIAFAIEEEFAKPRRDDPCGKLASFLAHQLENAINGVLKKGQVVLVKGGVEMHRET